MTLISSIISPPTYTRRLFYTTLDDYFCNSASSFISSDPNPFFIFSMEKVLGVRRTLLRYCGATTLPIIFFSSHSRPRRYQGPYHGPGRQTGVWDPYISLVVLLYVHTDTFDLTTAPELRIAFLYLFCTLGLGCIGADQVVE